MMNPGLILDKDLYLEKKSEVGSSTLELQRKLKHNPCTLIHHGDSKHVSNMNR